MKTNFVIGLLIFIGISGFVIGYIMAPTNVETVTSGSSSGQTSGGYGSSAPATSGGYGAAPASGGYGAPAPAAGGYGAPAPAAGGYGQ